jgi:mono/diheme cytochrome c family protein/glucose/arabinose dehydrogenase
MAPLSRIAALVLCSFMLSQCHKPNRPIPEKQAFKPSTINPVPTGDYLSPEESMKTIRLPEGYHLELVASEPVIQEPVAIVWDGNGRMYVAEMRSYMRDINGTGEDLPICRITRLEDTDGDGKMDKHTVFIDSLVLPRMMLTLDDRLVVNETYTYSLHSYRDTNGDGVADEKKLVYNNDKRDNANLEHQRSGLMWNIDNYIYITSSKARYRYVNGQMVADTIEGSGGQWGITRDDYGRIYYSCAGCESAATGFQQNPVYGWMDLPNQKEGDFDAVWPIIATPDVEGGLKRLRPDSTLNHFTASCGQTVYRGDRLPANLYGDLFIPEPVGRLIRRAKVSNVDGKIVLKNAYDRAEFIASTDMNFRPINMDTGPDGCMYIVDMYHGIIQEGNWTRPGSYLRNKILQKKLDKNIGRGRIYRLVHDGYKRGPQPKLLDASNEELVGYLNHPNGWWRDNAQKLLIVRNAQSTVPALQKLAKGERPYGKKLAPGKNEPTALARLHALWTLEGLQAIAPTLVKAALNDKDAQVRKAAIRISERYLKQKDTAVLAALEPMKNDPSANVRIQLAASLRYLPNEMAKPHLHELIVNNPTNELLLRTVSKSQQDGGDPAWKALVERTSKMTDDQREMIFEGANIFRQSCAICHGADGRGLPSGVAPPLAGSPRVNGDKNSLVRIILHGLTGPIDGVTYPGVMAPLGMNDDEYIACVTSFIRNSLGNDASFVGDKEVRKIRADAGKREIPWTLEELKTIK